MENGAGGKWDILSTSHGNAAVKIGFVLVVEVFYFRFHQVHALTPTSLETQRPLSLAVIPLYAVALFRFKARLICRDLFVCCSGSLEQTIFWFSDFSLGFEAGRGYLNADTRWYSCAPEETGLQNLH